MLSSVGQVEDSIGILKKQKLNKKCFALPSTIVHTKAHVETFRRKMQSRSGKIFFYPGDDGVRMELRFHYFNLFFIRYWLEWSLGIDSTRFVVKGWGHNGWDPYRDSVYTCDLYGLYKSRRLVCAPNRRPLWIYSQCPYSNMPSGKPVRPGYWKVKIDPENYQDYLLTMRRWNCSYAFKKDTLYFSNTLAASAGLPPNAEHLGLPKIDMVFSSDNFGGVLTPLDYRVSKDRKWYKMDLVCHIVNHYKLEHGYLAKVSNALSAVVDELSNPQLIKLCFFFAANAGEFEFNVFILSVDSYVRILIEQNVV